MKGHSTEGLAADLYEMLADKESPNLGKAAQLALVDGEALRVILNGITSRNDAYRYNCFRVLLQISQDRPALLYPAWDRLVELMGSQNAFHRSTALQLVAHLTHADVENRFEDVFDRYFALLDDDKVMVARYLAQGAGVVA